MNRQITTPWGTRLSQLLDDAFFGGAATGEAEWTSPRANVVELDNRYEISMDLPGLKSDEFEVEFEDNELRVSGERKVEREEQGKTFHRVERRYGKFRRSFTLPPDVDSENIDARYEQGVLTVAVPKSASQMPRKIEVK